MVSTIMILAIGTSGEPPRTAATCKQLSTNTQHNLMVHACGMDFYTSLT